jgi:NADH dehydrogenase
VVPVIGDGKYRISPVAVGDVAAGFVGALERPETVGRIYHCCGPADFSYDELLDLVAAALGKGPVPKLHHPLFLMKPAIALLQSLPRFPITGDQLTMLLEGNVCDPQPWAAAFDLRPQPFAEAIRAYLKP